MSKKKKKIYKSSDDGRFVPKEDIENFPEVTYTQVVEIPERNKKETEPADVEIEQGD